MKFKAGDGSGPSAYERYVERVRARTAYLSHWHDHFALLPREVAPGERRWLETIERRGTWNVHWDWDTDPPSGWWVWEYRAKQP